MRDDRVVEALERGMRRPLALAAAAFFIAMGVFVAGITLIVDSTRKEASFPAAVTVAAPPTAKYSVVVSFRAGVVGMTTHATVARGGAATPQQ